MDKVILLTLVPVMVAAIEIRDVVRPDVDVIIKPNMEVARNNPPLKSAKTPSKAVEIRTTLAKIGCAFINPKNLSESMVIIFMVAVAIGIKC